VNRKRLTGPLKGLHLAEDIVLMLLLGGLVALASAQILMRNLLDAGMPWADPLLRLLVLWLALAGALAATRENKHIRIDLLSRFLPEWLTSWTERFTSAFTALVCALLAWYGGRLVWFEYQDGSIIAPGVPAWIAELIIPLGFGLMALRFALRTLLPREEHICPNVSREAAKNAK